MSNDYEPLFSERHGYVKFEPQYEKMSIHLRRCLYNTYFDWHETMHNLDYIHGSNFVTDLPDAIIKGLIKELLVRDKDARVSFIKKWWMDQSRLWFEIYDIIEFTYKYTNLDKPRKLLVTRINNTLYKERVPYKLTDGRIIPLVDAAQVEAVDTAILSNPLTAAQKQIKQAVQAFSERSNPDYANVCKQSISAVESLCKWIARMPNETLHNALEKTASILSLHTRMTKSMIELWRYTNEAGIRHGMTNHADVTEDDARYMLVTCSAYINMIAEKARKQNKLPQLPSSE